MQFVHCFIHLETDLHMLTEFLILFFNNHSTDLQITYYYLRLHIYKIYILSFYIIYNLYRECMASLRNFAYFMY